MRNSEKDEMIPGLKKDQEDDFKTAILKRVASFNSLNALKLNCLINKLLNSKKRPLGRFFVSVRYFFVTTVMTFVVKG